MGFLYHFVSLNDEQSKRRRELLDNYGQFAQLSVLLLPLIYQVSLGLRLVAGRLRRKSDYRPVKEHQSPVTSQRKGRGETASGLSWRRIRWMLDGEVVAGWGKRMEWIIAGLWMGWLLLLVVRDTGDGKSIPSENPSHSPTREPRIAEVCVEDVSYVRLPLRSSCKNQLVLMAVSVAVLYIISICTPTKLTTYHQITSMSPDASA